MLGLCNFNCAFSIGSESLFWTRHFILCLPMIKLHCRSVLYEFLILDRRIFGKQKEVVSC